VELKLHIVYICALDETNLDILWIGGWVLIRFGHSGEEKSPYLSWESNPDNRVRSNNDWSRLGSPGVEWTIVEMIQSLHYQFPNFPFIILILFCSSLQNLRRFGLLKHLQFTQSFKTRIRESSQAALQIDLKHVMPLLAILLTGVVASLVLFGLEQCHQRHRLFHSDCDYNTQTAREISLIT